MNDSDNALRGAIEAGMKNVRDKARALPEVRDKRTALDPYQVDSKPRNPLPSIKPGVAANPPVSPDRSELNRTWDIATSAFIHTPPRTFWRLLSPVRAILLRFYRFLLGPLLEKQTRWNSAQVRFDNELVAYLDERMDQMGANYDRILGLYGKRMEEIDERHLILQRELIRHVHDLAQRIEFVFENAEQNHLYLEGMLRELNEGVEKLRTTIEMSVPKGDINR